MRNIAAVKIDVTPPNKRQKQRKQQQHTDIWLMSASGGSYLR